MDKTHWDNGGCPKYDCRKAACKCGLKYVNIPSALGDDSKNSSVAPSNGAYCNAVVEYMANGHIYLYSSEGVPTLVERGIENLEKMVEKVGDDLAQETLDRQAADDVLQQEIDDIKNSPDVVDIVPTYAALQSYDTSKLGNNDIVRVLADEMHDGQSTYYRWDATTSSWTYIGTVGDYYTKSQVDTLLGGKQNTLTAGSNISISDNTISATDTTYSAGTGLDLTGTTFSVDTTAIQPKLTAGTNISISDNTISATDTTYSNFTGTDGQTAGTSGLVPAPATTDTNKYLKSDGTWATVAGGGEKNVFYGTCSTGISTSAKVVDCAEFTSADLKKGTVIYIKFTYSSSYNPTLNINNTGAVATTAIGNIWVNGETVVFIHNGTSWEFVDGGVASTSIYGATKLHDSSTSTTDALALVPKTLNDVLTSIVTGASAYSTSATYAVGDYCRYGNNVYQCNTAIVGGETWDATHWDEVDSLQEQLDNTETWTFTLSDNTTVTKKVVVR